MRQIETARIKNHAEAIGIAAINVAPIATALTLAPGFGVALATLKIYHDYRQQASYLDAEYVNEDIERRMRKVGAFLGAATRAALPFIGFVVGGHLGPVGAFAGAATGVAISYAWEAGRNHIRKEQSTLPDSDYNLGQYLRRGFFRFVK